MHCQNSNQGPKKRDAATHKSDQKSSQLDLTKKEHRDKNQNKNNKLKDKTEIQQSNQQTVVAAGAWKLRLIDQLVGHMLRRVGSMCQYVLVGMKRDGWHWEARASCWKLMESFIASKNLPPAQLKAPNWKIGWHILPIELEFIKLIHNPINQI